MSDSETGGFRNFLFKALLICLVIPGAFLASAELLLRFSGAGYQTSLFIREKAADGKEYLRVNYQVGYRFFPGTLARKPLPETFLAQKPEGALRFFILGESAARGEQLADFSFARMLEAACNEGSDKKKVEVINTGIPAINSWVLREFAREIVNYQPDLIIIYAGHNEFIGPYGPAGVFGLARNRLAALTGIWASSLRMIQILKGDRVPAGLNNGWRGLEMFLNNLILPGSELIDLCQNNWAANLNDMFAAAKKAGVPVIWCRVPVNQRDCPPFASDNSGLSNDDQSALKMVADHIEAGDFKAADMLITGLRQKNGSHALCSYYEGRIRLALDDQAGARAAFEKAVSNDCFRVRTTDCFNEAAATCASSFNAACVDLEKLFAANSPNGIIGRDLVYDHVHLTLKGHYLAASGIFSAILASRPELPKAFPDFEKMTELIGFTAQDAVDNLEHVISSMSRPPFTLQSGNQKLIASLMTELEELKKQINPEICRAVTGASAGRLPGNWAALHRLALLSRETPAVAQSAFERSLAINPFNIDALNNLGLLHLSSGRLNEAETCFKRALELAPDFARAHFNLGLLYAEKKSDSTAAGHYRKAVQADPALAGAWRNLGNLLLKNSDHANALEVYRKGAAANPDDLMLQIGVGNCLLAGEKIIEGRDYFKLTVASFSASPLPVYSLALAHEKLNEMAEAATCLETAGNMGHLPAWTKLFEIYFADKITLSADQLIAAAENACRLSEFSDPWFMQILAAAYLQTGKKNEAAGLLTRALLLAQNQGKTGLAREIAENLKVAGAE